MKAVGALLAWGYFFYAFIVAPLQFFWSLALLVVFTRVKHLPMTPSDHGASDNEPRP